MEVNNSAAKTSFVKNQSALVTSNTGNKSNWSEIDASFLKDLEKPFGLEGHENDGKLRNDDQYTGFDNNAAEQYIYPINFPIRSYQYNITKVSLYRNTLIVLPTGLGKTFIAAVVMYNIYRWYPTGKVIFMAPTRPLVSQQIEACRKIMGMPPDDMAEMTGKQHKKVRIELWKSKRIFFATPQVVQIDINDPEVNFPFPKIKLIVVDEAHKAKGRYAYTEVIQTVVNRNPFFRVLALSATPGRRIEDVMEVIQNLCISHIEVRSENSIDVMPFTHKKNIKTIVVALGEELTKIRNSLINIIDPYIRNLIDNGVLNGNAGNFTKFWLIMEQKKFRELSIQSRHAKHSALSTDFSICISLYHALELLERHGLRVFLNFFDDPEQQHEKFFVQTNPKLKKMLDNLREEVGPNPFAISDQTMTNGEIQKIPDNLDFGHPKFDMVKKYLLDHFNEDSKSKVIVFCEFRESVMLMHRLLLQSRPLILPRVFVGQGGTGSIRAVSQKEQLQVMKDFRNGTVNTLIATSVAEEGIDVGEVNLIICFDISSKNPTRFVQRIGRTGRKRQGQVIMLATEGKEHGLVKEVLACRDKINQKIINNWQIKNILYKRSPRIVPPEYDPKCLEIFIKPEDEVVGMTGTKKNTRKKKADIETESSTDKNSENKKETKAGATNKRASRKKKIETITRAGQDVRNFFKKVELDEEDKAIFCSPSELSSTNFIDKNDLVRFDKINFDCSTAQFRNQNILPDTIAAEQVDSPENATTSFIESRFKKLNHFARYLDKRQQFANYAKILDTIKSKTCSKNVKKFILMKNIDFVREKYEAMQAICALDDVTDNRIEQDVEMIDESEKIIKSQYAHIQEILGDNIEVKNFLEENKKSKKYEYLRKLDTKFESVFREFEERDFQDSVQTFLNNKCNEIDQNCFISKITTKTEQASNSPNLITHENTKKTLNHGDNENSNKLQPKPEYDAVVHDETQWANFNTKVVHQSTPIAKQSIKSFYKNYDDSPMKSLYQKTFDRKNLTPVQENTEYHKGNSTSSYCDETVTSRIYDNKLDSDMIKASECENNMISADLFDDGFDEILADNEVLKSIEKINNAIKSFNAIVESEKTSHKVQDYKENSFLHESAKPPVIQISNVDYEKQISKNEQFNASSNEFEDFNLIDFLEPFEEEINSELQCKSEHSKISSQKENSPPLLQENISPFRSALLQHNALIERQVSDDIFDTSPTSSTNGKEQSIESRFLQSNAPKNTIASRGSFETSPSIIGRRKPNLSKLHFVPKKLNMTTADGIKTSTFQSINKTEDHVKSIASSANTSKSVPNNFYESKAVDDSVITIIRPQRNLNRVINSSDSEEEFNRSNIFEQKSPQSQEIQTTPGKTLYSERCNYRKINRRKRRRCEFVDDEAGHSGDDSNDSDSSHRDNGEFLSIIASQEEEDDSNVNMHAKYLQSIRSPQRLAPGAFKIPPPRQYMDLSRIFSQAVPDDTQGYKECSFVVSDEENIFDGEASAECPLEKAEAILRARRKAKRKERQEEKDGNITKKRKIIENFSTITLSDDDFE